jgi:ketosteroid isomerase-like protein
VKAVTQALMTEAEVLRIHQDSFYAALKDQDFATLEKLYSDRYMLIRPDGSVLNKQQVLQDLREGGLTFQSIGLEREQVGLFGSVAILTGESRTVSLRNGNETRAHFRLVAVYAQEDTAIRLVHFQSTGLPG